MSCRGPKGSVQNLPTPVPTDNHSQHGRHFHVRFYFCHFQIWQCRLRSADPDNQDNQGSALTNMVIPTTANKSNREMVHARGSQDRPYKDITSPCNGTFIIIIMLLPRTLGAVLHHKPCECYVA